MTGICIFLIVAILIGWAVNFWNKRDKNPTRLPSQRQPRPIVRDYERTVTRNFSQQQNTGRRPTKVGGTSGSNTDYLRYRNCPKCHSRNELNKHVIRKTSANSFYCSVCGNKFYI